MIYVATAAKNYAAMLRLSGTGVHKIICSVVTPEKLTKVLYANLTKKVQEHFLPKLSSVM